MTAGTWETWMDIHRKPLNFYITPPNQLSSYTTRFNTLSLDNYSQQHRVNWTEKVIQLSLTEAPSYRVVDGGWNNNVSEF